mmetsp:Transcript_33556/g.84499  ORF Transcript_33556/g.84499 Transcript_33556/m.84499 type:complete len:1400 (-) Transcript_33556:257-4456(-)
MQDLDEEDEDYFAMMASLERRQATHPRALALASVGRASRRVLTTEARGADGGRGSDEHAWRPPSQAAGGDNQRMVFLNAQDDLEFQEELKHFAGNKAALSWWDVVSPLGGTGATAALVFVLGVSGVKAIAEDVKRHSEDRKINTAVTHVLNPDGNLSDVRWEDVKVGDIVKVEDNELIPADLLCLNVALPDGVCFIKTTNLDGESNLKIRRPVQMSTGQASDTASLLRIKGVLECQKPNADLHSFRGCFSYSPEDDPTSSNSFPVTMNEVLLRGCMLKNSGSVYGMVIYTGDETRIQQNAAKIPFKVGAYDTFMNLQIAILMVVQAALCVFGAAMATTWRDNDGVQRYYIGADQDIQGNYENSVVFGIVSLLTYWIILSYMVPISLFVTMEIVKFWQGFMFINMDPYMVDPETTEGARCRNSNLMEDLGKIEYVFSDKTGTLTTNEMRLRSIAVKTHIYGKPTFKLEEHLSEPWEKCMELFDKDMLAPVRWLQRQQMYVELVKKGGSSHHVLKTSGSRDSINSLSNSLANSTENNTQQSWLKDAQDAANANQVQAAIHRLEAEILHASEDGIRGLQLVDFWLNICVCHSLLVEKGPDGEVIYQGPSPDEVALVEAARQLGFVFKHRDVHSVYLDFQGVPLQFDLLNVIEFSSERKRMSVVARCPDGTIRLFCKGADATILERLSMGQEAEYMQATQRHLRMFAQQGLRTLCLGTRVIPMGVYREWDIRFQAASSLMDGREEQMALLQDEVETELELVGVTAIEDKLQEGVPEAIATLLDGGIKVWMITGDKQETAINIATSCKLLKSPDDALVCNSDSYLACRGRLNELLLKVNPRHAVSHTTSGKDLRSTSRTLSRAISGGEKAAIKRTPSRPPPGAKTHELVVDGHTLSHILGTNLEPLLAELGTYCRSVVVCRASPSQKACIVRLMKDHEMKLAVGNAKGVVAWKRRFEKQVSAKMLSIGDGANDVGMIQAAHIGCGISGREGRAAVMAADYSFGQFSFLSRLLLVHGHWSYIRNEQVLFYAFYKNFVYVLGNFYYSFFTAFSAQPLYHAAMIATYNLLWTTLPTLVYAVTEQDVSATTLEEYPELYATTARMRRADTFRKFGYWTASGVWHSLVVFWVPLAALLGAHSFNGHIGGLYSFGAAVFTCCIITVNYKIALITHFWTWIMHVCTWAISIGLWFVFFALAGEVYHLIPALGLFPDLLGVYRFLYTSAAFWLGVVVLAPVVAILPDFLYRAAMLAFRPTEINIFQELESQAGKQTALQRAAAAPDKDVESGPAAPVTVKTLLARQHFARTMSAARPPSVALASILPGTPEDGGTASPRRAHRLTRSESLPPVGKFLSADITSSSSRPGSACVAQQGQGVGESHLSAPDDVEHTPVQQYKVHPADAEPAEEA